MFLGSAIEQSSEVLSLCASIPFTISESCRRAGPFPSRLPVDRSSLSLVLPIYAYRSHLGPDTKEAAEARRQWEEQGNEARRGAEGREGGTALTAPSLFITYFPQLSCASRELCVFSPLISELSCRTEHAMTARSEVLHER